MSLILDRVADISRLSPDSTNTHKESYVSYLPLANIPLNVQPAQAEDVVVAGGVFGQTYIGFTTASGILEGDKLILQLTGEQFIVKGKQNWMSPDLAPHIELLLVEFETGE
jgi:hypothetical protein